DAQLPSQLDGETVPQLEDLGEGGDEELPVVCRVVRSQVWQPFAAAQGAQLGQGEVLGEPPGDLGAVDDLGGAAVGEVGPVGDVGGPTDLVLVAGDQLAVRRRDEIRLQVVRAHPGRQLVGGQGVLGAITAGPAVR